MDYQQWSGCYDAGWRDLIVPAAFAHPAKMARGLVARIFDELFAMGALERGSVVVDPFGGIGTTAIEGASRGVQVVCCELEAKFVDLARQNFALHARDWETMGRPSPMIMQGDSRKLRESLGVVLASALVSSPPYIGGGHHPDQTGAWNTNGLGMNKGGTSLGSKEMAGYGREPGQLGQMKAGDVDAVISSPPYAEIASGSGGLNTKPAKHEGQQAGRSAASASQDTDSRYGESAGQLARMALGDVDAIVSSPPYEESVNSKAHGIDWTKVDRKAAGNRKRGEECKHAATLTDHLAYGETPGQLGAMKGGAGVDAVVSSPPFTQGYSGGGGINVKGYGKDGADKVGSRTYQGTGNERSEGNLETLTLGDVDAVVSSPPYEGSLHASDDGIDWTAAKRANNDHRGQQRPGASVAAAYPATDENIGNATGETFWSAALEIVRESYAILKPGGVAVWVVKAFVRDKKLVDFPGDWRKLCEHVGFETLTEVHASLVAEEVKSHLFDGEVTTRRERKSFFRRLAEKKGSPRIDWETVYIMRKPEIQ